MSRRNGSGGFITYYRRLINVLRAINRQWYYSYVASLSSAQQMRKSIQVQFKLILRPSSSCATPALCILLGVLGSEGRCDESISPPGDCNK